MFQFYILKAVLGDHGDKSSLSQKSTFSSKYELI